MDEKATLPTVPAAIKKVVDPCLVVACAHSGFAAHNLARQRTCDCELSPPSWFQWCYKLRAEDVDASGALLRGLLWCSAPQGAAAAALALLLKGRRRCRRALAFLALALAAPSQRMYGKIVGFSRANYPGDLFLATQTATVFGVVAVELLGFLALLLGAGGQ